MYDRRGAASLAGLPKELIENPNDPNAGAHLGRDDVLSGVLRNVRLSGSLQFCFMPTGTWEKDATPSLANMANSPSTTMPFHIVVEGPAG